MNANQRVMKNELINNVLASAKIPALVILAFLVGSGSGMQGDLIAEFGGRLSMAPGLYDMMMFSMLSVIVLIFAVRRSPAPAYIAVLAAWHVPLVLYVVGMWEVLPVIVGAHNADAMGLCLSVAPVMYAAYRFSGKKPAGHSND